MVAESTTPTTSTAISFSISWSRLPASTTVRTRANKRRKKHRLLEDTFATAATVPRTEDKLFSKAVPADFGEARRCWCLRSLSIVV
jgi:hypothetical protein